MPTFSFSDIFSPFLEGMIFQFMTADNSKIYCNIKEIMFLYLKETALRLELDSTKLRKAAFDMRPLPYLDAGLADLPISDLWHIGLTPEIGEWKSWLTWKQAFQVAPSVTKGLANQYIKPGLLPWDFIDPEPAY